MIGRASVLDHAFGGAHRLIRKSLQPQDPRKEDACPHPRVDLKAQDMPTAENDVIRKRAFQMTPCALLVAQKMLRHADQSLTDQPIARVGSARSQSAEPLCQCHGGGMLATGNVKGPQLPE